MHIKTPGLKTTLSELVAAPSVSCTDSSIDQSNRAVIELLETWCSDLGMHTRVQTVDDSTGKYNLIASIGSGERGLVLAGHTDTVPYDDWLWQHDPFSLTESDDRFYGLGIADMKCFFSLALDAIAGMELDKLQQPLILLATCDEETSMSGARAIARHGSDLGLNNARYAVIGEPTSLKPVRMHKGMMMQSIRITGSSGHSSNPALGTNAMESMHRVMTELLRWREQLQAGNHNPLFEVPVPTINFGHIHGGDNPNRICGHCELQIDIRPLPGMRVADLRHEMRQRLQALLQKDDIKLEFVDLFEGVDAMETSAASELVSFAEQLTGSDAQAVAFGTEAPYYNEMGMDSIVLGPGNIAQAHQPDEYLAAGTIDPYIRQLQQLIQRFCM
jgi:acetylornithine deacetylase